MTITTAAKISETMAPSLIRRAFGLFGLRFTHHAMAPAAKRPIAPAQISAGMLLSMLAVTHGASPCLTWTTPPDAVVSLPLGNAGGASDQHPVPLSRTSVVGANATSGAIIPAKFRPTSSKVPRPLMTISAKPTATIVPTNTSRAGEKYYPLIDVSQQS